MILSQSSCFLLGLFRYASQRFFGSRRCWGLVGIGGALARSPRKLREAVDAVEALQVGIEVAVLRCPSLSSFV